MTNLGELVDTWRRIIVGQHKSWVLFAHDTVVVFVGPTEDLAGEAVGILREYGPVHPGSPAGDFSTINLTAAPAGWSPGRPRPAPDGADETTSPARRRPTPRTPPRGSGSSPCQASQRALRQGRGLPLRLQERMPVWHPPALDDRSNVASCAPRARSVPWRRWSPRSPWWLSR